MSSSCPYHSRKWRSLVQHTINCLRQEGLVIGKHCRVFPRLVCSCLDKVPSRLEVPAVPQEVLKKWLEKLTDASTSDPAQSRNKSMKSLIESLSRLYLAASQETDLIQVLNLVYHIFQGETSCFEHPPQQLQATPSDAVPELRLKKKVFSLDIPVTPTQYIGTLIGTNGVHLKELCKSYDILDIHLGEETNKAGHRRGLHTSFIYNSPVKVTYQFDPTSRKGPLFEDALQRRVAVVKEKRERHFRMVQEYKKVKERRYRVQAQEELDDICDIKLAAEDNYFSGKQKKNKMKEQHRREKPPPVLADSHCLHCLMSYSKDTECRFHPGYIVQGKQTFKVWNCCDSSCETDINLQDDHIRTGCAIGQHIWRPNKSKKILSKASVDYGELVLRAQPKS